MKQYISHPKHVLCRPFPAELPAAKSGKGLNLGGGSTIELIPLEVVVGNENQYSFFHNPEVRVPISSSQVVFVASDGRAQVWAKRRLVINGVGTVIAVPVDEVLMVQGQVEVPEASPTPSTSEY